MELSNQVTIIISAIAFAMIVIILARALPMTSQERKEYEFYMNEFKSKVGGKITFSRKLAAYNGAKGGPAPKWH